MSRLCRINAVMMTIPMQPRYITISEVEYKFEASLIQAPITENMKAAKSIHRDCIGGNCYLVQGSVASLKLRLCCRTDIPFTPPRRRAIIRQEEVPERHPTMAYVPSPGGWRRRPREVPVPKRQNGSMPLVVHATALKCLAVPPTVLPESTKPGEQ